MSGQQPPAFRPEAFESEIGFWLYPTDEVFSKVQRHREVPQLSPRTLAKRFEMITGQIVECEISGERFAADSTLRVTFEDEAGGVSELVFDTVVRRTTRNSRRPTKTYYTNPTLHPSEALQTDADYEWDDEQQIVKIDFI